jgi:predicted NAD/FAD-binding protein
VAGKESLQHLPHPDFSSFFCSKKYIDSILSQLPAERLHLSTPVHSVSSGEDNATLVTDKGTRETFDHIIFACHTDDALRILDAGSGATPEERDILGAFSWAKNDVWLHCDERVGVILPHRSERWWLTPRLAS